MRGRAQILLQLQMKIKSFDSRSDIDKLSVTTVQLLPLIAFLQGMRELQCVALSVKNVSDDYMNHFCEKLCFYSA